jgi:Asp-tRNA(Asn)/Glu-tRNA(Gln) amidotransferase B subunit
MVRHYVSRDEMMLEKIFQDLRGGKSLFSACEKVNISTKDFYAIIEKKSVFREKFLCSLSDYADRCVDDIRDIVGQLKAGEIDNSTAKLLIETMKWMVNKVQSDIVEVEKGEEIGDEDGIKEIVVKFI